MNISRLSTLSLTLAIAVITLGYVNSSFAAKPTCPDHPSCKDSGDNAKYTAALTMGGFQFDAMDVTLNKRRDTYRGNGELDMDRPEDTTDAAAWDKVFAACKGRLSLGTISSVSVDEDDYKIVNGGGEGGDIRIRFMNILANSAVIDFDLIGTADMPFIPESSDPPSKFKLDRFVIFGDAAHGQSCRSSRDTDPVLTTTPSSLEIKRTN